MAADEHAAALARASPIPAGGQATSSANDSSLEVELTRLLGMPPAMRQRELAQQYEVAPARVAVLQRRLQHLETVGLLPESGPDDLEPGTQIGDYRLEQRLGSGGWGVVFAALHIPSSRAVALKLLRPGSVAGDVEQARFRREARAIARMVHPGICPLYDAGEVDGTPFLAMPRIEGCSLAEYIARTRAEEGDAATTAGVALHGLHGRNRVAAIVQLVERIASALQHAHERGVVHRDVKPSNVLIDRAGEPVLIDFGLVLGHEDAQARVTATTAIVGTPLYLAPEMVAGNARTADPALDVYGLGVLLFECLTLRPPFAESDRQELYHAILRTPPPDPRRHNPFVPRDLVAVVQAAMAKEPARRYQSARAFAADLARVRLGQPIALRRRSWPARMAAWGRTHPGVGWLLVALSLTQATIAWQAWRAIDDERVAVAQAALADKYVAWTRLLAAAANVTTAEELARELVPSTPEMAPRLAAWVREHGEPLAALLPEVQRALGQLAMGEATPRTTLLRDELTALEPKLARFTCTDGALFLVRQRLAWAESIWQRSVGDFAADWEEACAAVRASPCYGHLDLTPLVGLVPLGPDPSTGFWEFADLASGEDGAAASVPRRDPNGRLVLDPAMGLVFVLLPGGTFVQGAQTDDPAGLNYDPEAYGRSEGPPHAVRLDPFLMSKYEMTQAQWRRLCGRDPSFWQEGTPRKECGHSLLQPVEQVSWDAAYEVLTALGLELPTSAQWEYGARGGTSSARYTGGDALSLVGFENLAGSDAAGEVAEPWLLPVRDGFIGPSPVGTFRANPFGLHDVYGNVQEWCRDSLPAVIDVPWYIMAQARDGDGLRAGPPSATHRLLRGGLGARTLRSGHWAALRSTSSGPWGVRPVRTLIRSQYD